MPLAHLGRFAGRLQVVGGVDAHRLGEAVAGGGAGDVGGHKGLGDHPGEELHHVVGVNLSS
jgi:hypothetical protein